MCGLGRVGVEGGEMACWSVGVPDPVVEMSGVDGWECGALKVQESSEEVA